MLGASGGTGNGSSASGGALVIHAIFVPGTSSPVTIGLQLATLNGGTAALAAYFASSLSSTVEWTVLRIV